MMKKVVRKPVGSVSPHVDGGEVTVTYGITLGTNKAFSSARWDTMCKLTRAPGESPEACLARADAVASEFFQGNVRESLAIVERVIQRS